MGTIQDSAPEAKYATVTSKARAGVLTCGVFFEKAYSRYAVTTAPVVPKTARSSLYPLSVAQGIINFARKNAATEHKENKSTGIYLQDTPENSTSYPHRFFGYTRVHNSAPLAVTRVLEILPYIEDGNSSKTQLDSKSSSSGSAKLIEKVEAKTTDLTVITEAPKSLLIERLSPIVAHVFQNISHTDIKTHTHQTSVTIANQQYDLVIKRIGGNIDRSTSNEVDKDHGFAHKSKEMTILRQVNNSVKISTTKEIFIVNESEPLRAELLEMLSKGYGKPGVAIDPALEKKYNHGLAYPKNNGAATHYGYVNRNSREKPIDYLHRVFGKYLQHRAWVMYRSELSKQDSSLESMLRDTIGGELRSHIPSKPPKELLSRLKMTP